jgi:hypothetical protein
MNLLTCAFAVLLCLVNAVLWTLVSQLPMASAGWLVAAVVSVFLYRWSSQ